MAAIQHAQRIIDWSSNLQTDEMPPPWMWPYEEELEIWFEEVEEKRKAKYDVGGSSSSATDDDTSMTRNELSKGRGR